MTTEELKQELKRLQKELKPWTGQDWADHWYKNKESISLADMFDLAIKVAENRGRMGL
jgi:hypothetical protein